MARVVIDSRIFSMALKLPFLPRSHPDYPLAHQAQVFVAKRLEGDDILLSAQVAAEVLHVMTQRGHKVPDELAGELITDLLACPNVHYAAPDLPTFLSALDLSSRTGIHIWDFLTVLPFEGRIETIHTMDPHFRECKELQIAPVANPFGDWRKEGQK